MCANSWPGRNIYASCVLPSQALIEGMYQLKEQLCEAFLSDEQNEYLLLNHTYIITCVYIHVHANCTHHVI